MDDSSINNEHSADPSELANSDDTLECPPQLAKSEEPKLQLEVVWTARQARSSTEQMDLLLEPTMELLLSQSPHAKFDAPSDCNSSESLGTYIKAQKEKQQEEQQQEQEEEEEAERNQTLQLVIQNSDSDRGFHVYADSEMAVTSDEDDKKPSDSKMSVEELHSDLDVKESKSLQSYKSEMDRRHTPSEDQLHATPLDESYSVMSSIDLSTPIDEGRQQLPIRSNEGERLLAILADSKNWDIKVYIGNFKFYCHLCVLQAYSLYFRQCKVESFVVRLPTHKVTPQSFHIVYNWMLQDNPAHRKHVSNRCLLELYSAAKFLRIKELIDIVWSTLDIIKNENEAFMLLPDMTYVDMETFDFLCFSRISRFFLTLVASMEFAEMDESYVCRLLNSHNVGVNSEIEIFYSTVRWLSYKWPKRQIHVAKLLGCVRFGLLSPVFLRFLQTRQTTRVMDYISKCPSVQEQINRAFIYVSAELYCKDPKQSLPFPLPEYDVPEQRRWLYDKNCSYHHDLRCSQRQFFTYEQFLGYLRTLHETGPDYWRNLEYILHPVNCCSRVLSE